MDSSASPAADAAAPATAPAMTPLPEPTPSEVMDAIRAASPSCPKFDCVYLNTPWHRLSAEQLAALPVPDMCQPDAALLLWCDTHTAGAAADLIKGWGFQFHSVAAVVTLAEKPAAAAALAASLAVAPASNVEAPAVGEEAPAEKAAEDAEAAAPAVKTKARGPRVKIINPPAWWTGTEIAGPQLSRPCSEQLWVAVRGAGPDLNPKAKPFPFQVVGAPEMAKKTHRARQPSAWCPPGWFCRRPVGFLSETIDALADSCQVAELFGDEPNDRAWALGPCLPTGCVPPLGSCAGLVGVFKEALGTDGKVALRSLSGKLKKAIGGGEVADTVSALLVKATSLSGDVVEGDENLRIASWVADFKLAHHPPRPKKAKRKSPAQPGADRPRHGIAAPGPVSAALCEFLGEPEGTLLARTEVVRRVNAYVASHGLKDKKFVRMDAALRALLSPPDESAVTYFSLCRLLSPHFIKVPKADAKEDDDSDKENDPNLANQQPKKQKADA